MLPGPAASGPTPVPICWVGVGVAVMSLPPSSPGSCCQGASRSLGNQAQPSAGLGRTPRLPALLALNGCEPTGLTSLTTSPRAGREVRKERLGQNRQRTTCPGPRSPPSGTSTLHPRGLEGTGPPQTRVENDSQAGGSPSFLSPEWASLPPSHQLGLIKG